MISHWFTPEDRVDCRPERISAGSLWHQVRFLHEEDTQPAGSDLFLIGFDPDTTRAVKRHLYGFSAVSAQALRIVDCGYLTQGDPEAVLPVLQELRALGAVVVLLGPPPGFARHQVQDARLACLIRESNLDDDVYLRGETPGLVRQYIGTQRHLVTEAGERIEGHIRLSELKLDISLAEPCLRDADCVLFHTDAMHAAEAGYMTGRSASGLSVIEACQLFRYAGAARHIGTLGLYGLDQELDAGSLMANNIAQMLWYLLEGSTLREDPEKSRLTEYHVDLKETEQTLVFYKSEVSGRWWVRTQSGRKAACSYQDYRRACDDDYTDLILKVMVG